MSEYDILGLEPSFEIDLGELEKAYFSAQRKWHPDRFMTKSQEEQVEASQKSTQVNGAYQVLRDPLKRARALYQVLEGAYPTASQSAELLGEMMTLQEKLLEDPKLGKSEVAHRLVECKEALASAFNNDIKAVPQLVDRYAYLLRLQESA